MNFYKRINHYLVNHFPTLWNTHFVWILLAGIVIHVLTYIFAYSSVDIAVMKEYSVSSLIFNTNYFSFYMILSLLLLIYLCIQFLSHNPLKSYYPVSKYYLTRVAGILLPIIMIWTMLPVTFLEGVKQKALRIATVEEMEKDARAYDEMKPLLFKNKEEYHLDHRNYPAPFPLTEYRDFYGSNGLGNLDGSKPYIVLGENIYQYGIEKDIDPDTCREENAFEPVDVSKVYGLSEYSLYNYPCADREGDSNSFIANLHRWYMNQDKKSLENIYNKGIAVFNKYNIEHNLDAKRMTELLLQQDLNKKQLLITGSKSPYNGYVEYTDTTVFNKFYTAANEFEEINIFHNNALLSGYSETDWFWIVLFTSIFIISALICLKYIPLIPLVFSICISGVLGILTGLIFIAVDKTGIDSENLSWLGLFIALTIFITALYFIYKNTIKKLSLFAILPLFGSGIGLIASLFSAAQILSKYEVKARCDDDFNTFYAYSFHSSHALIPVILLVLLLFHAIRHVHAKSDNT